MAYNIELSSITAGSDNLITSITLLVADNTTPVTGLTGSNFVITSNITLTDAPTVTDNTNGVYTIAFVTKPNITTDYVVIKVTNAPNEVKLFVDPAEVFNSSGQATFSNFNVKTPGQYTFVLDQVDLQTGLDKSSPAYNFVKAANATNSSIAIANQNPNQAIVITNPTTGSPVSLIVTLKDADNAVITGTNSVSIYSNPLFD